MRQRTDGFTLVELLVASVIMVTILGALGSLFLSTSKAYRVNDKVSTLQQSADAAGQLLSYEIGLAGYKGSTDAASSNSRKFVTLTLVPTSTLTIIKGASATESDTITVRYFEDRFTDTVEQLVITLNAVPSGSNRNLYRRQEKQKDIDVLPYNQPDRQPAVEDVYNLKVLRYIKKDGSEVTSLTNATDLAALRLEFTLVIDQETTKQQVVVDLKNLQNVPVLPTL